MVASFDDVFWSTDVLRSLLVGMEFDSSPGLLHCDQACFDAGGRLHDGWIVSPLKIEERVLKGVGTRVSCVQFCAKPSEKNIVL